MAATRWGRTAAMVAAVWSTSIGQGAARVASAVQALAQVLVPASTEAAPPTRLLATKAAPATPIRRA